MGTALEQHPMLFETDGVFRPGNMVDYLVGQTDADTKVTVLLFVGNNTPHIQTATVQHPNDKNISER